MSVSLQNKSLFGCMNWNIKCIFLFTLGCCCVEFHCINVLQVVYPLSSMDPSTSFFFSTFFCKYVAMKILEVVFWSYRAYAPSTP